MEILFGNKGIYHYMDAKVGTMQELEEHGRMYQVRMLVENELPYILPSSMICTDAEVWLSHNTKDCYGLQAYLQQKTMNGTQLKKVLNQIMQQADALEAYLLDASDLVIRVEYLFMQKEKNEIRMLCVPGYQKPLKEQLTAFLEYLMPRFSHEDRAGELFLYECHRVLTDEWSDMTDFLALLNAGTDTDGRCRKQGEKTSMQKPNSSEENEFAEEAVTLEQKVACADIDAIFSKRFLLYALAGGAALALIIKYLFFDGTTGTAIFGIVWLLTLIILAIMTARDKEDGQESESAMQEYGRQVQGDETLEDAPVQGYSRQAEQAVHSVEESDDPEARKLTIREANYCPAGRLKAWDKDKGEFIENKLEPSLVLLEDPQERCSGPLFVRGGIPIDDTEGVRYELRNRVTLCRCGASSNKPFCDGTHVSIRFRDGLPGPHGGIK